MSTRAVYIARIDGGERLSMVRLLGPRSDQAWLVENIDTEANADRVLLDVQSAVTWLADRMSDTGSKTVDLLCIDAEGQRCTWIEGATPDLRIARASLMARSDTAWNPTAGFSSTGDATDAYSFHLLNGHRNGTGGSNGHDMRKAVVATSNALIRLLLDTLDEQGLNAGRVTSLPQAVAQAWDPDSAVRVRASKSSISGDDDIASELDHRASMVTGVVVVDPAGRIVWTWSRAGDLLCFGTLAAPVRSDDEGVRLTQNLASRLTADWVAWSVQTGQTLDRIVVIGPASPVPFKPGEPQTMLSLGEFGSAIASSWNGASCDVVPMDDPIGQTLDRVVVAMEQGIGVQHLPAMEEIEHRPSRAHKSVRRWMSLAGIIAAAALIGVGARAQSHAHTVREAGAKHRSAAVQEAKDLITDLDAAFARTDLQSRIQKMTATTVDTTIPKMPSILKELDNISVALNGHPDAVVEQMQFNPNFVMLKITVPDLPQYEALRNTFTNGIPSLVDWNNITTRAGVEKQSVTLQGRWLSEENP
ncbi:MAG: hypothetical protein H6815_05735 [Phycisphaeraceae bacterium]|nr:hypothetical protein [Phycisphaerales bacterium]MCB9859939.1 hypothetical protein [Phycisphaeraceae bacterium]